MHHRLRRLGLANHADLPFVQEVHAAFIAVKEAYPDTDVVIELGGEDAKIIFLTGGVEQRMNGSCAGGTGAFIDQMATLLGVTADELDRLALQAEQVYPIASRCGVFAKSDIQPLLNQGARREDISASIFQAVVDQTVSGLAQGRQIQGKVLFLGGPCPSRRDSERRLCRLWDWTMPMRYSRKRHRCSWHTAAPCSPRKAALPCACQTAWKSCRRHGAVNSA